MASATQGTRVILISRKRVHEQDDAYDARMKELLGLCDAVQADVIAQFRQQRADPDPATYVGDGKVAEISATVQTANAELVIADGELTPGQIRNLESRLSCRVIDRTQLILDIFALRANSQVGRLQVEMAQLQYLLPRLSGRGVEMSRLGGGIGTRGPGETKLEVDRRRIRRRIARLREQLTATHRTRAVQRSRRIASIPAVALVGYTNAGKSTLLARWNDDRGDAMQLSAGGNERLFDTLDPLARRVRAGTRGHVVLLDTVGFVQDLPHLLIDAFRATLEEVVLADVIVHVVDATTDPLIRSATTYQVLSEIGALDKPVITFYNKMDQCLGRPTPDKAAEVTVYGSAISGEGIADLYRAVDSVLGFDPVRMVVEGSADSESFWARISEDARIMESEATEGGNVRFVVEVDRRQVELFRGLGAQCER